VAAARFDPALAQLAPKADDMRTEPVNTWTDADKWAWSKIESGQTADFDQRENCGNGWASDPERESDPAWDDPCRKVSARFLEDILTKAPWREAVPFKGIVITHAKIDGDINLENARLIRGFWINVSLIDGAVNLRRVRTDGLIGLRERW